MSLVENFRNIFKIEELRTRILYTVGILMVYRIGTFITMPGVDASQLVSGPSNATDLLGLFDLFVGGAFARAGVFALGIMPYITAAIIIQLMGAVVPYFQKLQREGEEGRRKINQLTRYGTVVITMVQAVGFCNKPDVYFTGCHCNIQNGIHYKQRHHTHRRYGFRNVAR